MDRMQIAPHGTWRSPITTDLLVADAIGLSSPRLDRDAIYWLELRPAEQGRIVLVRHRDGLREELTPPPLSVRSRAHEYGGGAYTLCDGTVYFSADADQRLHRRAPSGEITALSEAAAVRYADGLVDARRQLWFGVREDHRGAGEPVNSLVRLPLTVPAGTGEIVAAGCDFYASPRLRGDGQALAWLSWDHPRMPWDGTELWVAALDATGRPGPARCVAGGPEESIFQPEWGPDGSLYFVSDRSGWWNLYRLRGEAVEPLCPMDAEFGLPMWQFGMRTYGITGDGRLLSAYTRDGVWRLGLLDPDRHQLTPVPLPFTELGDVHVDGRRAVFLAGAPDQVGAVVELDLATGATQVLRRASSLALDPGYLSRPRPVTCGSTGGRQTHALYYPPHNRDYQPVPGERPPLIVKSHGGPTAAASSALNLVVQFWTSRGFAVLDVNYGGSTGHGRPYRDSLRGQWGVVDVDDCIAAALHLARSGEVDGERMAIVGGSAGGYTTLCALAFRDVFRAGISRYGVSDPSALARDTHKFESRYLDSLIGPYPACEALYRERSPLAHAHRLRRPVLFLQGLEDRVVPPSQSETLADALRQAGIPVAYLAFPGEQHGFRRRDSIVRSIEAELAFLARIFGFSPADPVPALDIDNL
jgi:dipeptidyl aminopeptidase/acylaminoacyl peptidase